MLEDIVEPRELGIRLREKHFSPEYIRECLEEDKDKTLRALQVETEKGNLSIYDDEGKKSWKVVWDFYEKRYKTPGRNQELINEDMHQLINYIYEVTCPERKRIKLDTLTDAFLCFSICITLGLTYSPLKWAKKLQRKIRYGYVSRKLGLDYSSLKVYGKKMSSIL